jgi:hypothetical protein
MLTLLHTYRRCVYVRYDIDYISHRRYALQNYLRRLIKDPILLKQSQELRDFLGRY